MGAPENIAAVRTLYQALAQGDPAPLLVSAAPSYRYTAHTRNRWHGTYTLDGVLQALAETGEVTGGAFELEVVDVQAVGKEMVVAHTRVSLAAGDSRIENADVVAVFAFESGLIVDAVEVNSPRLNAFWATVGDPADAQY